jgi:thiol-disulfide isomerase/thioredoxin
MKKRIVWLALLIIVAALPGFLLLYARKSLRGFEGLQPGDALPGSRLESADGIPVETSSWLGFPTLLVVFQPGCNPCRVEISSLASIAPSFPNVKIVLLSTDRNVAGVQAPFPVYFDPDGRFLRKVRKLVTPAVYWIDELGKVRYARAGQRSARDEEALLRRLTENRR